MKKRACLIFRGSCRHGTRLTAITWRALHSSGCLRCVHSRVSFGMQFYLWCVCTSIRVLIWFRVHPDFTRGQLHPGYLVRGERGWAQAMSFFPTVKQTRRQPSSSISQILRVDSSVPLAHVIEYLGTGRLCFRETALFKLQFAANGNEVEVEAMLDSSNDVTSKDNLCHPLCSCDKCEKLQTRWVTVRTTPLSRTGNS